MSLDTRAAAPRRSVPAAPDSRAATLARLLRPGGPRSGPGTLAALAVVGVLVPVLLVVVFRAVDPSRGSWLLGLVLGLVVDVLLGVLLLGLVTYRATTRELHDQRRALAKVETRTSRQDATLRRQPEVRRTVETAVDRLGNRLQATQNLFALVAPHGPVPSMVGYVASPDVLLVLVQKFLALRPSLTIECGSGTSTLFLALAAQQHGVPGRIVSLENNREYAEGTRALLAEHGVDHLAEVRYAPLRRPRCPTTRAPGTTPPRSRTCTTSGWRSSTARPGTAARRPATRWSRCWRTGWRPPARS